MSVDGPRWPRCRAARAWPCSAPRATRASWAAGPWPSWASTLDRAHLPGPPDPRTRSGACRPSGRSPRCPGRSTWPVFLVPPPVVPELLDQCGAAGVTTSYIITSGFGEAPEGDGRRLDTALREACARWPGMGVAGPNGEGVFDVAGDFALPPSRPWTTSGASRSGRSPAPSPWWPRVRASASA